MTSPSDNNNGSRDDELVGRLLAGRYRINRRIGVGGMGAVYEAFHVDLRRKVAVKVLLDPRKRAIERFEQEAFANAKVHSPHVVNVIDFIVDEGGREPPFIVMELLDGEPLSQRLQREKTIPLATAIEITRRFGGFWSLVGLLRYIPRPIRDWLYDRVASNRYRWFGRQELCLVPSPQQMDRFLP